MKTKINRVLCFLASLLFILPLFSFYTFAASTIDATDVLSDLRLMSEFDIEQYDKNEKDTYISLITLDEYGYDYNGFANDYGLYVYLYNPSGRKLLDNTKAKIRISVSTDSKGDPVYEKYGLTLLSYSMEPGYEYVFYKFKVNIPSSFYGRLKPSKRVYKLSGIEIQKDGDIIVEEYDIGSTYTYNGYSAYHGPDRSSDHSTLYCKAEGLETVSLDVRPASWKSISSDKGLNHQYELSSIYFAVPNYWLEKYGSESDLYKGLYGLTAEWYEYKTNGLITTNEELYELALSARDIYFENVTAKLGFNLHVKNCEFGDRCYFNHLYCPDSDRSSGKIPALMNVIKISSDSFKGLSSLSTAEVLKNAEGGYNTFFFVDDGRIYGYNKKEFTVKDGALNDQIKSYASIHNDFFTWLLGYGDANQDADGYSDIDVFKMVTDQDFSGDSISENALKLFVCDEDYIHLREYYNSFDHDEYTVYLMRFAVTDYVMGKADVGNSSLLGNPYGTENYYFEKSIFLDFDVLDLTFYNQKTGYKTLPVVSKPIDIIGNITHTPGSSGPDWELPNIFDSNKDDPWEIIISILSILLIVALVCFLVWGGFKLWDMYLKTSENIRKNNAARKQRQNNKNRRK